MVKDRYLSRTPKRLIDIEARKIISEALKGIKIDVLADATKRSLIKFYETQYATIRRINGDNLFFLLACIKVIDKDNKYVKNVPLSRAINTVKQLSLYKGYDSVNLYGNAMQKFCKDYIEQDVKPVFDRLIKEFPKDPDDISGHNSLRNRAEMEVRYNGHQSNIEDLKAQGHRLVIASSHADCSERCRGWQGRVYSLDGTSGRTDDGRAYIPLEIATDVYYTTKAGKTYKNGLLGFNCRHYLEPYKSGYKFPKPNPKAEAKEYPITQKQRALERKVREYRTKAIYNRDINRDEYLKFRKKAIDSNKEYIKYSRDNNRAYYPSRTKIL